MKTTYTQKIMASHDAPQQIEALIEAMNAEKQRRNAFREWVTPNMKAEFINGKIITHSPVKSRHWEITDLLSGIIGIYVKLHRLGRTGVEKVMIALDRNDYEPDLVFFSTEKAALFTDDQVLFPAPDLAVEILSPKTAAKDRGIKKKDYAANRILEYWIIDPTRNQVEQYILLSPNDQAYSPPKILTIYDDIESIAIPGFTIPVLAIFDQSANVQAIQSFLQSTPTHK